MLTIKAVIFDFDGLILDTESAEFQAWQELFGEHDVPIPIDLWSTWIGTAADTFDPIGYLEQQTGRRLDRDGLRRRWRQRFLGVLSGYQVRPGVQEYLTAARRLGLRIGLASSSSRNWVVGHLTEHGLADRFETICTSDDVERVKPDPALYRLAAAKLGVEPESALAFEDSPNGAKAARAAGLRCVIVPNPLTRQFQFPPVDLRLESMAEVSLEALLERVTGGAAE